MKTALPAVALNRFGSSPTVSVKVTWPSGAVTYTDRLLDVGALSSTARVGQVGAVAGASFSLDDTDGVIKAIWNTQDVVGSDVEIYQNYPSETPYLLYKGKISSNLVWSEGNRTVSINTESVDTSTDIDYPAVFGNVRYVPARLTDPPVKGTLKHREVAAVIATIAVEGGSDFPQATPITIGVNTAFASTALGTGVYDYVLFEGSFTGDDFTVTLANAPNNTALAVANRVADADFFNPRVLWLADATKSIVGEYCNVSGMEVNLCWKQEGNKCWFRKDWTTTAGALARLNATYTIDESQVSLPARWGKGYWEGATSVIPDSYQFQAGTAVYYMADRETVYTVNTFASTSVRGVWAYRALSEGAEPVLQPVPSSYYTVNLAGPTTISFTVPLEDRTREGWSSDIYADVESTVSGNTATAIKYLLDNHTDLTTDAVTFTSVATAIDGVRSNFALLTNMDAFTLANEMAWQARCALYISQGVVKIKYLNVVPSSSLTLDASSVEYQSIVAGLTESSELVTHYDITWRPNYLPDTEQEFAVEENVASYGRREQSQDFYIYTEKANVEASANFWLKRYANTWRTVTLTSFPAAMVLDSFDGVTLAVDEVSTNPLLGEVQDVNQEFDSQSIGLRLMLASRPLDSASGQPTQNNDFWTYVTPPSSTPDPLAGLAAYDYAIEKWPLEYTSSAPPQQSLKLVVTTSATSVKRGESFDVTVTLYNGDSIYAISGDYSLEAIATDPLDVLSVSTVSLVNGTKTLTVNVDGGSGTGNFVVFASDPANETITLVESSTVSFNVDGEVQFVTFPTIVMRGIEFNFTMSGGLPSTSYNVALNISSTDTLDPLTVTTDGSGNISYSGIINDDTTDSSTFTITVSKGAYSITSPQATLINAQAKLEGDVEFVDADYNNEIRSDLLRTLGSVWVKSAADVWTVENPGAMYRDGVGAASKLYGTSLGFEFSAASGLDCTVARNVSGDPPGAINPDDIELSLFIRPGGVTNSMIASLDYAKLYNTPPSVGNHDLDSATHPDVDIYQALETNHALVWNDVLSKWMNDPVLVRKSGQYVVDGVLRVLGDFDIVFDGGTIGSPAAAPDNSGIGWLYTGTRYAAWSYYNSKISLVDGASGFAPDGTVAVAYTPSATNSSRLLTLNCKINFETTNGLYFTRPGGGLAMTPAGVYMHYTATRFAGWGFNGTQLSLMDGVVGGSSDSSIIYFGSATTSERKFDIRCILRANATDPVAGQVLSADTNLKPKWIDVPSGLPDTSAATEDKYAMWDDSANAWVLVGTVDIRICVGGVVRTYRIPGVDIT